MIVYKLVHKPSYGSLTVDQLPYVKFYVPGTIVAADPRTVGLMAYDTVSGARIAYQSYFKHWPDIPLTLLKAEAHDIRTDIDYICSWHSTLDDFYTLPYEQTIIISVPLPPGVVCCMSMEILEEVIPCH